MHRPLGDGTAAPEEPTGGEPADPHRHGHGSRHGPGSPAKTTRSLGDGPLLSDRSVEHVVDHQTRVGDVVQAILRVALEAAAQQPPDRRRYLRRQRSQVDLALQHPGERLGHRVALEQAPAGEHLEEHHPERPDVRPLVDREALRLLRRHVGRGPQHHSHLRRSERQRRRRRELRGRSRPRGGTRRVHRLRQSEVEDFDFPFYGSFDVLRLEIPVDDPLLMRLFQGLGDLARQRQRLI